MTLIEKLQVASLIGSLVLILTIMGLSIAQQRRHKKQSRRSDAHIKQLHDKHMEWMNNALAKQKNEGKEPWERE